MICLNVDNFINLQGNRTDTEMAELLGVSRCHLWKVKNNKKFAGCRFVRNFQKAFPNEDINDYFFKSRRLFERNN